MSVISICCCKDSESDYESVEFSKQWVQAAQNSRPIQDTYIPAQGYMQRIARQVKPWQEGTDLYFYAESHSGLNWTGLALFMALAELAAIRETGAYFSFSIDEQDFAARQLFYDHYHRFGHVGPAVDAKQAIDFIFNQLTQLRQTQDGDNIADWYAYTKFVQNKVHYAKKIQVMIKPTGSIDVAVSSNTESEPGLVVLGKRPRNQYEQLMQLHQAQNRCVGSTLANAAKQSRSMILAKVVGSLVKALVALWALIKLVETHKPLALPASLTSNSFLADWQVGAESHALCVSRG